MSLQPPRSPLNEQHLLEREGELEQIRAALDAALEGRGSLLLAQAHAGLGKSELVHAARQLGAERSMTPLPARGADLERDFPFGCALQIFEPAVAALSEGEREELLTGAAGLARPLLNGDTVTPAEDGEFSLLHGLYWLAANLADRDPLLVLADDLHWWDRPSLRFLLYLQQRLEGLRICVVAATRPAEPGAPVELIRALETHPEVRRLHPAPLGAAGVRRLMAVRLAGADHAFADACGELTQGNPFLLNELVAGLVQADIEPNAASVGRLRDFAPDSVLSATLVRLARLPGAAAALARAVAILGDDAELRHAAHLAGVELRLAADAADALVAADIVQSGDPLVFVHPLLHSAIYEDLPPSDRARAHARAARLLVDEATPVERVAAHLLVAERGGREWVVDVLRRAGSHALGRGSADSAARYLSRALAEPPTAELRSTVLVELGEAEGLTGEPSAGERLEEALELETESEARARILLAHGWMIHKAGDPVASAEIFDRGRRELHGADEDLERELVAAYLGAAMLAPSHAERAGTLMQGIVTRPDAERSASERAVLANILFMKLLQGEWHEEVRELAERILHGGALLDQEGAESLPMWLAIGCLSWTDSLEAAVRATDDALADAHRRGAALMLAQGSYARSWPYLWMGRVSEAVADAQLAVDAWSNGWGMYLPAACYWLTVGLLERDEIEAAAAVVDRPQMEERWGTTAMYALFLSGRGRVSAARGESQAALDDQLAAGEQLERSHIVNPSPLPWRSDAALAASALGEHDRALELAEEELALARRFGARRPIGVSLRALGLVSGGEAGIELLREAVETLAASPAALEHARALVDLGAALRRAGQRSGAREPLREGLEMAQGFGALALERRAFDELAAAGARLRRRELSGVESLTPSERRVAQMAAQGLSNREIAEALFVTSKAVQWHLRNCYRKLEIEGRGEFAEALERGGTAATTERLDTAAGAPG